MVSNKKKVQLCCVFAVQQRSVSHNNFKNVPRTVYKEDPE